MALPVDFFLKKYYNDGRKNIKDEDNDRFAQLAEEFGGMEKTAESDRIIENISALLPRLFGYCPELVALHSDPEIPAEKYDEAMDVREDAATSGTPRLTKNVFPAFKTVRYGNEDLEEDELDGDDDYDDDDDEDTDYVEAAESTKPRPSFFRKMVDDLEEMQSPYFWIVTVLSVVLFGVLFGVTVTFTASHVSLISAICVFIAVLNIFNLLLYIPFSDHERKWIGIVVIVILILLWFYAPTYLKENYMNYL